ncbi:hypothetical protein [Methylobacterium sp. GC_Met_2]|uniref:hypothetical protein n=1 Tax=Methylobacterium sp. GC_Met_2 TaxID=2937376 RepID=UPI00226B830D|nr:hypothetical protein [Methylobacterium sp. GC_Met_2]
MNSERADIFADADMDLSKFKPKTGDSPKGPGPEALAGAGGPKFASRDPASAPPPPQVKPTGGKWRYRTGRDQQFNTRASQATIDGYNALAERLNCPIAEVVERALHALQRETTGLSEGEASPVR